MVQGKISSSSTKNNKRAAHGDNEFESPTKAPRHTTLDPKPDPKACLCQVTQEDFHDFLCARAYDIISDNRYRKHLARCKEGGDNWAITLQTSISAVQGAIKQVNSTVAKLKEMTTLNLHRACKEVIDSTSAPTKIREGWYPCCITGAKAEGCLDIGKSCTGKNHTHTMKPGERGDQICNKDLVVHPRFQHFFLMLWYVSKIEHVIRNYTRCWIEAVSLPSTSDNPNKTVTDICNEFSTQNEVFQQMYKVFIHGHAHVMNSLHKYMNPV